jgi:hypothetical protein
LAQDVLGTLGVVLDQLVEERRLNVLPDLLVWLFSSEFESERVRE